MAGGTGGYASAATTEPADGNRGPLCALSSHTGLKRCKVTQHLIGSAFRDKVLSGRVTKHGERLAAVPELRLFGITGEVDSSLDDGRHGVPAGLGLYIFHSALKQIQCLYTKASAVAGNEHYGEDRSPKNSDAGSVLVTSNRSLARVHAT